MPHRFHVVNSSVPPNEFVRIAKEVGPAVVNINTETLPKQSTNKRRNPHGFQQMPQNPTAAMTIRTAISRVKGGDKAKDKVQDQMISKTSSTVSLWADSRPGWRRRRWTGA